jgi:hypothetical protein
MEGMILYNRIVEIMLSKGLLIRAPYIHPSEIAGLVKKQSFLTGWIGKRRPLTSTEISGIYFNMIKMSLHGCLKVGFIQVAQSEEVRQYFMRGLKITQNHIEVFNSLFSEENLNSPISWQSMITNSTTTPFSDKFMMFQIQMSTATAIAFYGAALAVCNRRDLATHYIRLIGELLPFAEDGENIMINNGWMEEPPTADDRMALAKSKREN